MNLKSEEFHNKYNEMLNKEVKVILNNDYEIVGFFNDEFYEDHSIMISNETIVTIKIDAIKSISLVEE